MTASKTVATTYDEQGNVTKTVTTIVETPDSPEPGVGLYL